MKDNEKFDEIYHIILELACIIHMEIDKSNWCEMNKNGLEIALKILRERII